MQEGTRGMAKPHIYTNRKIDQQQQQARGVVAFNALLLQRFDVARIPRKGTYTAMIQEQGDGLGIAHRDLEHPEMGRRQPKKLNVLYPRLPSYLYSLCC